MKSRSLTKLVSIAVIILAAGLWLIMGLGAVTAQEPTEDDISAQAVVGTTFTYQGRLTDSGNPANGTYDFEFKLYDALTGGNIITPTVGGVVVRNDVPVANGLFTVNLDFGNAFDGKAAWLQIAVRPGASTGAYTILSPRQPLNAVPYALFALNAGVNGLRVLKPSGDGLYVDSPGSDGVEVQNAKGSGLFIINPTYSGLDVRNPGDDGLNVTAPKDDGVSVNTPSGDGLYVVSPGSDGVEVQNAKGSGVFVVNPTYSGLDVRNPGDDGLNVTAPGNNGVEVSNAKGNGVYVNGANEYAGWFNGRRGVRTNILEIAGGSDLAEPFEIAQAETIEPGMVVAIDPDHPGQLRMADKAYDRMVAGIISGAGGIRPGLIMQQEGTVAAGSHPVALTGRVYVWVDASFGSIQPGDLLTTSDTPGHAMKVTDYEQAQGAILGKAMSSLEEGQGLVLVLVSLQ